MEQVHRPGDTNVLITGASTTGFIGSRSSLEAEGQIRILTNNKVLTLQRNVPCSDVSLFFLFLQVLWLYIWHEFV